MPTDDKTLVTPNIGFAVADGRPIIIAVESSVAAIFVVVVSAVSTDGRSKLVKRAWH
jgi:hypothetical protein